jgi:hypothetical protein
MEFILEQPNLLRWTPEEIHDRNPFFEFAYSKYIMQRLIAIHPGFRIFMVPEVEPDCCTCFSKCYTKQQADTEDLARQCSQCWEGIDEILVIMGVKLALNREEHVLGETMLQRKLAKLQGLSTDFVC